MSSVVSETRACQEMSSRQQTKEAKTDRQTGETGAVEKDAQCNKKKKKKKKKKSVGVGYITILHAL